MRRLLLSLCAVSCLLFWSAGAAAQEHSMWYVLQEEHVNPGMTEEYESATKAWIAAMDAAQSPLYFFAMKDQNGTYTYVVMINNFAEIDTLMGHWGQATRLMEPTAAANRRKAVQWSRYTIWLGMPQLSYNPATPALSMDDAKYFESADIKVRPDKEGEFLAAVGKLKGIYAKHGIDRGWEIYRGIVGVQGPVYAVVWSGKDPADVWNWYKGLKPEFGADIMPVMNEIADLMESEVEGRGWAKPELSRFPKGN